MTIRLPSVMPTEERRAHQEALQQVGAVCAALDEFSSDCHRIADELEKDTGVVVDLINPEDEESLVIHLDRAREHVREALRQTG